MAAWHPERRRLETQKNALAHIRPLLAEHKTLLNRSLAVIMNRLKL